MKKSLLVLFALIGFSGYAFAEDAAAPAAAADTSAEAAAPAADEAPAAEAKSE